MHILFDERDPVVLAGLEYVETFRQQREFGGVKTDEIDQLLSEVRKLAVGID